MPKESLSASLCSTGMVNAFQWCVLGLLLANLGAIITIGVHLSRKIEDAYFRVVGYRWREFRETPAHSDGISPSSSLEKA